MPYLPACSHPFWTTQLKALIAHILCDRASSISSQAFPMRKPNLSRHFLATLQFKLAFFIDQCLITAFVIKICAKGSVGMHLAWMAIL